MAQNGRIAIVGSGISGLACAHLLDDVHDIVLFEADDRLGGHSNTVVVDDPEAGPLGVDTGFIVHNDRNYPNLVRLLDQLGVETIESEMSFAVTDRASGFTYRATNLDTLLADRQNLLSPRLWRMVFDIVRFHRSGRRFLQNPDADPSITIGQYLLDGGYSSPFIDLHLIPMGAAVWSADPATFDQFPALSLLRFLHNHGLLSIGDRPQWKTIKGGSQTYVQAIADDLRGEIRLNTRVTGIERSNGGITLTSEHIPRRATAAGAITTTDTTGTGTGTGTERFDQVIVATHSDQALSMLTDPSPQEKDVLGAVAYQPNRATLHTDVSLLPPKRKAWGAWNYERLHDAGTAATLTYDLTTLQRLPGSRRYLVSLNCEDRIAPSTVLASFDYAHPVFDSGAIEAQGRIDEINGVANTWFCGAWQGYGFHEDGMASAVAVARSLGATW